MSQPRFVQKAAQEKTGAMVALFLDSDLANDLAIPGGESPEELHITLAYLGEADDIKDQGGLIRAVSGLAESLGVLSGRLNGLARFKAKKGDKTPYVILPDLPDLPEARQLIVSTLRENGYSASRDHGYIPHITIAYQDDGDPWPADNVGERKITFKTISLCLGDERHDFDLTGRYPVINKMDFFNERLEGGDDSPFLSPDIIKAVWKGGPTSGNFAHAGRPGKHGGSLSGGGHGKLGVKGKPTKRKIQAAKKKRASKKTTSSKGSSGAKEKKPAAQAKELTPGAKTIQSVGRTTKDGRKMLIGTPTSALKDFKYRRSASAQERDLVRSMEDAIAAGQVKETKLTPQSSRYELVGGGTKKKGSKAAPAKKRTAAQIVKDGPDNPTDFRSYLINERNKQRQGKGGITAAQAKEADAQFKKQRKAAKPKTARKTKAPSQAVSKIIKDGPDNPTDFRSYLLNERNKGTITAAQAKEADKEFKRSRKTQKAGFVTPDIIKAIWKGGPTSGNWGHVGRPGKHGGSAGGGGHKAVPFQGKPTRRKLSAAAKKVRKQRTEKRAFNKAKETLLSGRGLEDLSRDELLTLSARLDGMLGKSGDQNTKIAKEKPGNQKGAATIALGATPDKRYNMQYEVVELSDLVASNTQGGGINPDFPKELQPRDRSRAASKAQINKIASNLEPDALLGEFSSIDRGTPILGLDDNAVESGNGRTLALQRAKDAHPEQWNKYQNRLKETAQDRGIDPATLDGYENPVLIRRRTDKGVDRVQFAKDANTAQILGESASERARNDASRITSESLQHIDVRGDINATIQAPTNRAFVRNFIANTPETERAALMTGDGNLTKVGRDRIKGAMFNRVYDSPELSDKIFEALDDDTKNLTNGLMNSLGSMSKAQELVRTGQRNKDLDIAGDITRAVTEFDRLKASGQNIDTFLSQGNLFGDGLNQTQTKILREIDKRRRSGKKMQEFFEVWPQLVDQEPHPQQAGLFGSGGRSKSQLVDDWITMAGRDNSAQIGLF